MSILSVRPFPVDFLRLVTKLSLTLVIFPIFSIKAVAEVCDTLVIPNQFFDAESLVAAPSAVIKPVSLSELFS